ncbi:chain length determinant protein EpsF [Candidatus Methylocalor cossyra]|uniref:Chain length determinant protein EpsF n=1 Tax=Candidatus Methylocalor cossyra TaxID=3108543 RepID=A0ABP1C9I7_9GAMM
MSMQQLWRVVRAQWRMILAVQGTVVVVALLANLFLPKRYVAETQLVIDTKSADPILGAILTATTIASYLTTQADIIRSDRVAQRVVTRLGLDQDPAVRARWQTETEGKIPLEIWYGRVLKRHLNVLPARDSSVITVAYTAQDPHRAAAVANAFAQAYIETNLELKVEPAKEYARWFDERTRSLRENLAAAQKRLSDYQHQHGIVATDERLDVETARLNELATQLVQVQGQRANTRSRHGQSAAAETLPEVLQNGLVQSLKSELARLEAQRSHAAERFGANHPELARLDTEIAALRRKLAAETQRIAHSLGTASRADAAREAEIQAALDAQKKKVLELRAERDTIAVLQREVENAQRIFDTVTQRYAQISLESQAQQTNVSVLTPASEPVRPSNPSPVITLLLAAAFGAVLGTGTALGLELLGPRVRGPEDLNGPLGLPVLAVLPAVRSKDLRLPEAGLPDPVRP